MEAVVRMLKIIPMFSIVLGIPLRNSNLFQIGKRLNTLDKINPKNFYEFLGLFNEKRLEIFEIDIPMKSNFIRI